MNTSTKIKTTSNKYQTGNCVYMLLCSDGSYYTGWTTDFSHRLQAHISGKGAKYTRSRLPVKPVYLEYVEDRSHGLKREHSIKKLTHIQKCQLIDSPSNQL
ncbi:MAG: GIY-YIG nuclease family protein [Bacillota bacterium]|nr:GIY-YIG nuclease family protein [Bacillota bacterium]